jgi:hypothetical protein
MHAVVNKLTLAKPLDEALIQKVESDLVPRMRAQKGFSGMQIVRVTDAEAILLVFFETREALDELSRSVAAPWFADNVRPYLGGPVQRSVGEVVSSA